MKDAGLSGIKAIIVYPMNALAKSQYEDMVNRLQNSGSEDCIIFRDTKNSPDVAIATFFGNNWKKRALGIVKFFKTEIQSNPPDILLTKLRYA